MTLGLVLRVRSEARAGRSDAGHLSRERVEIEFVVRLDSLIDNAVAFRAGNTEQDIPRLRLSTVQRRCPRLANATLDKFRCTGDTAAVVAADRQLHTRFERGTVDGSIGANIKRDTGVAKPDLKAFIRHGYWIAWLARLPD